MSDKWREIAGGFDQHEPDWPYQSGYDIAVKEGYKGKKEEWLAIETEATPTEGSSKFVTSGDLYTALQALKAEILEDLAEAELQPEGES